MLVTIAEKNIGMLCMQEFFFLGGGGEWITWNIVSDVFIISKGKKSINAEKNENVELIHTCRRFCVVRITVTKINCIGATDTF